MITLTEQENDTLADEVNDKLDELAYTAFRWREGQKHYADVRVPQVVEITVDVSDWGNTVNRQEGVCYHDDYEVPWVATLERVTRQGQTLTAKYRVEL